MEKFTKRIILFLTLTLGLIGSASAAVRTFVPTATGTYAWTGNWGTNPVTGDDIIILPAAGATVTITGVPTISLATMTIGVSPTGTTGTVVLQSASGVTITLTGTSTPFRAFCNLTLGSAVSINAGNNGATAAASIAASRTVSVGANTFTWTGGGAFSVGTGGALTNASGGTINFTRSGSQSLPANMTIAGTLFLGGNATTNVKTWTSGISNTIGSTGKLQIGGGSTGAATTSGTAPTYSAGASLEYSATIAQTIAISDVSAASTGVNLIVSNATTNGISLGASRTFNNVTFTTGKLNLAGFTLTVNGAFSGMTGTSTCIMGGATGTANTCGLVVNGTGAAGTVWMSQSAGFTALKTFTFNRTSGTISFANSHLIATNGAYNLYSGTVTTGSFLQFYTGTTLTRYVNGLMSAAPTMFSGSYNIVYGDGTTQNITTGVELLTGTSSLNNFTVNNSAGTVTLNTSTSPTVNGTLTINAGKLAIGANTLYIEGDLANASGVITGSTSSNLTINGSGTLTGSLKLDQTSAATRTIATYSQNQASTGVVNLGSDMIVSSSFTFGSTGGLFALNNFNLSLGVSATIGGTPAVTKMIVTNGTGQMIKNFATGNTSQFTFPIGDNITGGEYSPVAIDYSANSVARNIGVRVVDDNPPGTLVTDYLSRYWVFTDDQLANTYTLASMDLYYNQSGDLNGTEGNILPAGWNGTTWAPYPGSITAFSDYVTVTGNESTALLNGRTITGRLTPPVYTWIATSGSGDWQVGTNWTPTRSNPTANDVLQFINGGTPTATNVPTQTISSLEISGNTSVILTPTSTNTLTISDGTGADLDIQSGSSLSLSGNLTISFTSTGTPTTTIAGTLTVGSGSNYDGYYAATTLTGTHNNNGTTTLYSFTTADIYNVNSGGVFVNSGTLSGFAAASFIVNNGGKYQHNLSSGTIPTATWNAGSTCEVTGAISSIPSGMGQTFSNFTWNTSTQSTNVTLNSDLNVTGTFTMANSAGTTYALTISSSYDIICGNYAQTGGRLNMSASGTGNLLVSGSFSMSAGQINTTSSGIGLITFNGTASQNVNITGGTILGASASLPVNYRVNGTVGINIVTGSTLTVGQGATMQISRGSITQAGTGVVTYNTTASTLLYNSTTAAQTVTAVEFPSTNSPTNLTINNTLGLSLPASFVRSLTGTLTMTAGNFNLAANTFSLGTSASVPGTLNYTAGLIVNGTFTRWFSTTGINTAQQTDPEFPMGVGVSGRKLWMWRSGTFTTGGSISVAFNNTSGLTSITPFIDGTLSVDKRTNQFWGITTSGWAGSGTISMEAFWEDAPFTISSASQLRLIQASSAVGSVGSNTGFTPDWEIQRTGLTTTNLNNNFYVGTAAANMISDIQSVADGSWLTPATWNCACVPGAGDNVTINNTHDITLAAAGAVADNLTVNSGGTLTLNDAAATLTVGPACGGNRNYINNGSLTISAGTLTVGGNVQMTGSNANFTMSGGSLVIDGNDGTSTGSVAENTPMLRIGSINTLTVTAGTITIVDPHFATPSGANGTYLNRAGTAFYYSGSSDSWAGNTFVLGGTSCTNTSTATNGFIIDASLITFGNFTVNGGTGARVVAPTNNTSSTDITIGGNLLINSGCTLQTFEGTYPSSSIYVVGNVTNNGTLNITSGRDFGLAPNNYWYSTGNAAAQTVSGTGTFTLAGDFYINNEATATPNVTFSVPITIGGDLFMYHGKNSIGTNNFTVTGNVDNQSNAFGTTNMFIANSTGRFQRVIPISPSSFDTYLFPIGENTGTLEYSPASLNFSANTTSAKTVGLNVTDALHPNHDSPIAGGAARISRYWSIATTPTTGTYTYTGYCQYLTADVTAPEASIEMQNWDGSAWTTVPGGAIDDINNRLEFGSTTTSAIFPLTSAIIAGRQSPPPANDACLGAITIACNDSKSGSTNSATDDGSLVNCGGTGFNFKGVWYVMTAPSVSQVTLSLCTGTSFDSYIRVYSGTSCASLTCVTSNDQYCGNQSQVSFNANGTSNYYILVSGYYASEFGSYTLTSTCVPIPLNNDCPGTNIVVDAAAISGTTIGANQTVNDNYGPGYDDDDVWYTFTAPATGNAIITLTENPSSPTFDGVLELRTTAACPATRIQARDFTIGGGSTERMRVSGLTPSAVYRLRVFSYGSTGTYKGPFTIGVATGYTAPANDNVCNAITATVGTVTCNTNTNYGFQIGEPTGSNWDFDVDLHTSVPSNTQWYAFTPTAAGSYTISASMGSGIQMGIYTATANSCANILIAANRTEIFSDYTFGGTVTASAQCLTAGTTYYIQLNGDMGSTGTPSLTITNNNPAAPVVNAITTFDCNSFTATWPAVTNATGYRVDVATNPGFSPMLVTDFNNGTSTSYAGGGLTPGQIYYVRVRTEGACSFTSANSSSQSITLTPLPGTVVATAGTNATTTSIDANWGAAANATSYVLEVSTVSNFASTVFNSNVGNVTTYTVNTPPLTPGTPYYYRVTAVNACGNAAVSNTITYATLPLVGGSLTWTGASSTDWNTPGNWTPAGPPTVNDDILIPNQTNDPVLTTGANGVCKSVTINSGATVTINTGKTIDVKGNWTGANNVVSGPGDLIFSGTTAQTISGGAVISNLQINNTSGVTAAAGVNTVNVTTALELKEGVFTTNGNVIIVSSAGTPLTAVQAYINDFTTGMNGSLSGTVRVERYITAGPNGFRYIGAPVNRNDLTNNTFPVSSLTGFVLSGTPGQLIPSADCSPLNSAPNSPYGNFMYWVENSNYGSPLCRQRGWWFQTSGNMQLGRGYGAKLGSGNKLTYTGFANNGSITHNCTHTVVFGNLQNGWNLVSNPFPSAITINSTSADASNPNNNMPAGFDGDIKFFETSGSFTGTFQPQNAGVAPVNIALGQGFWVRVTDPGTANWTLTDGHRVEGSAYYYNTNAVEDHLNITVSGNDFMDQTDINFMPEATPGFDFYDASKWLSANGQPTLYTLIGEDLIAINSNPSLENTVAIPMGLVPGADGVFTLNFNDIASFPQSAMMVLEDLQLDSLVDLRQNNSYTFTMLETDSTDRFIIHFQPGVTATVVDQDCDNATGSITYTQNGTTVWSSYNVKDNNNNTYAQGTNYTGVLTVNNLAPQEYILNLTHASGYTTQEFFTVNSQGVPVVVSLTASDTTITMGDMVTLTATAANATGYAWNFGDGSNVTGGTSQQHTYVSPGIYTAVITANNDSCSKADSVIIHVADTTTGINNNTVSNLSIFGQGDRVVVQFNNWGGNKADIFMYNSLGQRVESLTGVSTVKGRQELNVAGIKPGYYFIQVVSNNKVEGRKIYLGTN